MLRRPPSSTLFPTRRSSDLFDAPKRPGHCLGIDLDPSGIKRDRSEEHTSELQSRRDLVCRLLLEKKNRQPACGRKVQIGSTKWRLPLFHREYMNYNGPARQR